MKATAEGWIHKNEIHYLIFGIQGFWFFRSTWLCIRKKTWIPCEILGQGSKEQDKLVKGFFHKMVEHEDNMYQKKKPKEFHDGTLVPHVPSDMECK